MNMFPQQSRKRSREAQLPSLSVLRRPSASADLWLLRDVAKQEEPRPLSRACLSSQELFLSVVMEWHRAASDGYSSDDNSDAEPQSPQPSHSKRPLDEESPTSVHNPPRALTPLRLDCVMEPAKMIGVYAPAERRELLQRYMAKRARRLSQHKVRYGVRKTLANARPRVKGRFVKTVQPLTAAAVEAQQQQ